MNSWNTLCAPMESCAARFYLEKGWYKDSNWCHAGVMKETGKIVALLPGKVSWLQLLLTLKLEKKKDNHGNEDLFEKRPCIL